MDTLIFQARAAQLFRKCYGYGGMHDADHADLASLYLGLRVAPARISQNANKQHSVN